jgi:hypothetical protein
MKRLSYLTLICLSIIGVQAKANASVVSLVDLNLADAMSITGQTNTVGGITVTERYAESTLIPYDSQYPFPVGSCTSAIVTPSHTYFDKVVSFTGAIAGDLFRLRRFVGSQRRFYDRLGGCLFWPAPDSRSSGAGL